MQSFHTESDDAPQPEDGEQSIQVCGIDALPPRACHRFTLPNGDEIAIYNVNGEYYATGTSVLIVVLHYQKVRCLATSLNADGMVGSLTYEPASV
jgi:hypothetical protein